MFLPGFDLSHTDPAHLITPGRLGSRLSTIIAVDDADRDPSDMWGFHKTYPRLGLLKKPGSQVGTSCLPFSPPGAIAFISIARRALRVQRSDSARSLSLLSSIFSFDLFFCQNSRLAHSRRQKMHLFLEDDLKGGEGRRTFVGGKEAHTHTPQQ